MPISLADLSVGTLHDRHALLVVWGVSSSDNDDNLRCFYRTADDIAIFVPEQNVGHPGSDRTYANWLAKNQLIMECTRRITLRTTHSGEQDAAPKLGCSSGAASRRSSRISAR